MVDLYVGVTAQRETALKAAGIAVPSVISVRALIDTGASGTVIDSAALKPLALSPTGIVPIHTPSTAGKTVTCLQFDVLLAIYHPRFSLVMGTLPVIESDLASAGIQALIGRDVLARCLFIYDGDAGQFTLAF